MAKAMVELEAKVWKEAIKKVEFATCKGRSRWPLAGILIHLTPSKVQFVATDTHRLSLYTVHKPHSVKCDEVSHADVVCNAKQLKSIKVKKDDMVAIYIDTDLAQMEKHLKYEGWDEHGMCKSCGADNSCRCEHKLQVSGTGAAVTVNQGKPKMIDVIEGKFPRYTTIVPKSYDGSYKFAVKEAIAALKVAGNIASSETHAVNVEADKGKMYVTSFDADDPKTDVDIGLTAEVSRPRPKAVKLNWKYVSEALSKIYDVEAVLEIKTDGAPMRIKEGPWSHLIMPVNVKDTWPSMDDIRARRTKKVLAVEKKQVEKSRPKKHNVEKGETIRYCQWCGKQLDNWHKDHCDKDCRKQAKELGRKYCAICGGEHTGESRKCDSCANAQAA